MNVNIAIGRIEKMRELHKKLRFDADNLTREDKVELMTILDKEIERLLDLEIKDETL